MNDNPFVTEPLCQERRKIEEERLARDKERLDRYEELLSKVSSCQIQLTEISKNHESKLTDHEKRIDEIEHQPKAWMDKIISGIIAAVVAALMGVVFK